MRVEALRRSIGYVSEARAKRALIDALLVVLVGEGRIAGDHQYL